MLIPVGGHSLPLFDISVLHNLTPAQYIALQPLAFVDTALHLFFDLCCRLSFQAGNLSAAQFKIRPGLIRKLPSALI